MGRCHLRASPGMAQWLRPDAPGCRTLVLPAESWAFARVETCRETFTLLLLRGQRLGSWEGRGVNSLWTTLLQSQGCSKLKPSRASRGQILSRKRETYIQHSFRLEGEFPSQLLLDSCANTRSLVDLCTLQFSSVYPAQFLFCNPSGPLTTKYRSLFF